MAAKFSRRTIIGAASALAASTSLTPSISTPAVADARLVALWEDWQAAWEAHEKAHEEYVDLDTRANWPVRPEYGATEAERDAWTAARHRENERSGVAAAESRAWQLWDRVREIEAEMAQGEAEGILGALLRARVLATRPFPDARDVGAALAVALRHDLERLAAMAGPAPEPNDCIKEWLDDAAPSTLPVNRA